MRIDSIDIAAFGKLKDFHMELSDRMTVIFGENEKGKTTLMSFIRMMFYGYSGKVTDAQRNPRVKYRPWNSEIMAGSISFTHDGVRYRLEREFKKSNSADKITLINLDLNTVQSFSGSEDIGAKFFGLTDAAFERSVFIGELGMPTKNDAANGEINAKLSNIAVTGDEDISYEAVRMRLQTAKDALLSKSGKKGKCDKAIVQKEELEKKILSAKETENDIKLIQKRILKKEEEIKESSAETARLFELLKNADKIKKRLFIQRYIDAQRDLAKCNRRLTLNNGHIADEAYVWASEKLYQNTIEIQKKLDTLEKDAFILNNELNALKTSIAHKESTSSDLISSAMATEREDIDRKIDELRSASLKLHTKIEALKPEKKLNPLFFTMGAILTALGVTFVGFQLYAAITLMLAGIILFICGFIFKRTVKPDDSELREQISLNSKNISILLDQKQALIERIASHKKSINDADIKLAAEKALLENKQIDVTEKNAELSAAKKDFQLAANDLFSHLAKLSSVNNISDAKKLIDEISDAVSSSDLINQKLHLLADHSGCTSLEDAEAKLLNYNSAGLPENMTVAEIDLVKDSFKTQADANGKMRAELSALKASLKSLTDSADSIEVLVREQCELEKKIEDYKCFCSSAEIAVSTLDEAFTELRRNYSDTLDSRTAQIFKAISDDRYKSVSVSKNFDLNVTTEDTFGLKSAAYLSDGTENQLYLSLRLAISELIAESGTVLPIFMDDPFSNYDDNRAFNAISFLKDYSKDKQVIMFTCHSSFANMAAQQKIEIKEL